MGRPPKEEEGKARQALMDAFWELLAEDDYTQLSIRSLSNRAHVNHNTFYRYFENIDDLAKRRLRRSYPNKRPTFLGKQRLLKTSILSLFSITRCFAIIPTLRASSS